MKILSAKQIQALDAYIIAHEPIAAIDLMERAALALTQAMLQDTEATSFVLFCGPGNNGGDGLAVARMLHEAGKTVAVYDVRKEGQEGSASREANLQRLLEAGIQPQRLSERTTLPQPGDACVVDALFGSGLNRPLSGHFASLVKHLNTLAKHTVAIDIPSGLYADAVPLKPIVAIEATQTLSLQFPKRCFFDRFTARFVGKYRILDIQLHPEAIGATLTKDVLLSLEEVKGLYRARQRFSYKNSFGHALLMAGATHTFGAALIAGKACLKGGVGLLDLLVPKGFEARVNVFLPEAMVVEDKHEACLTILPELNRYQALAIGPGIGQQQETAQLLQGVLQQCNVPLVLDADALNLLAQDVKLLEKLPPNSLLTPHIGEFKRLIGVEELPEDYLDQALAFAEKYQCTLILKDSITTVCTAKGMRYYVDEGSPALATAGSGDALCGLLLALLANGYTPEQAAKLGVWLHARAGRIAGEALGEEGTLAREIPDYFKHAFDALKK
jgi:NAD(P)H-hydrate epimerase